MCVCIDSIEYHIWIIRFYGYCDVFMIVQWSCASCSAMIVYINNRIVPATCVLSKAPVPVTLLFLE